MKVLVTGATGFLGRRLVPALIRGGHHVVATGRARGRTPAGVDVMPLDVRDPGGFLTLPAADVVVHAAVARDAARIDDLIDVNVRGTANVLEWARAGGARRLVYCSTLAVYRLPQPLPICEDGPTYPVDSADAAYAISKLAGELLCERARARQAFPCISLRLARVYGPGEPAGTLLGQWIHQAMVGDAIVVHGGGERSFDFLYVDDAVRAVVAAVQGDAVGVFNVGSGVETTWKALAAAVVRTFCPPGAASPIRYVAEGSRTRCWLDIGRAERALCFRPSQALDEGLAAWRDELAAAEAAQR